MRISVVQMSAGHDKASGLDQPHQPLGGNRIEQARSGRRVPEHRRRA